MNKSMIKYEKVNLRSEVLLTLMIVYEFYCGFMPQKPEALRKNAC